MVQRDTKEATEGDYTGTMHGSVKSYKGSELEGNLWPAEGGGGEGAQPRGHSGFSEAELSKMSE